MIRYSVTPRERGVLAGRVSEFHGREHCRERLTGVDESHGAHGTAGIVEDPLLVGDGVGVDVGAVGALELRDDELDDALGVVAVGGDGALRQLVQLLGVEDVEALEVLVEDVVDGHEHAQDGAQEHEPAAQAVARPFGRHGSGRLRRDG